MKRKIALICVLALIVVCLTSLVSYADNTADDKAGLLLALDITDEMLLKRDNVTRGEFALLIAKSLNTGVDKSIISSENPFADLYKYEEGAELYLYLKKLGIIKGDEENKFNKKELITVEQAYTIMLRAMGYGYELEGDPESRQPLLMLANIAGINIGRVITDNLTVDDAVYMIYKMLHSENFTVPGYLKYEINVEKQSFLEYYWHIEEKEGIVTANEITHISSADKYVAKGKIMLGNKLYDDVSGYANELLGFNVKVYVNKDDEIIYANKNRNNEFYLTSENEPKYSNFAVKYLTASDKQTEIKLDKSFVVIYNGVATKSTAHININDGDIRFADNNNDNLYDVVFVNENKYIFVQTVNTKEKILIDKNDKTFKLNCNPDLDKITEFYIGDEKIEDFDSLSTDMLIRVNADENQRYIRGYISTDFKEGTLNGVNTDEETIEINGESFEINSYYFAWYNKISVGASGYFYMDDLGKIAAFVPYSEGEIMKYGYVMGAKKETGIKTGFKVMLLTENGDKKSYNLNESCIVDGYKVKEGDVTFDNLFVDNSGNTEYQLIRYSTDENGRFIKVDTLASNNDYASFSTPNDAEDALKVEISRGGRKYKSISKLFLPYSTTESFRINENTRVFAVPSSIGTKDELTSYDSDSFESGVGFSNDTVYQIEGYNIDKSGLVKAAVVYQSVKPSVGGGSQFGVVYKTSTVLDENDNVTTQIDYYDGTGFKALLLSEEEHQANKTFLPGDFIRFETNQKGIALTVQVDYSHQRGVEYSPAGEDGSFEIRKMVPYYIKDGFMIGKTSEKQYVYDIKSCTKIEFVESTNNILPAGEDTIKCQPDYGADASEVFIVFTYSSPRAMIIYNK